MHNKLLWINAPNVAPSIGFVSSHQLFEHLYSRVLPDSEQWDKITSFVSTSKH